MGHTPTNVTVNRDASGSWIEASFTLNSRHVVIFTREGNFIQNIRLTANGSEVWDVDTPESSHATIVLFTAIRWPFTLEGVKCVFTFGLRGTKASGKLEVGGTIVFTI